MFYHIHNRLYNLIFLYILLSISLIITYTSHSYNNVQRAISNKSSLQAASCCNYNNNSFELFHCILNQTNNFILQSKQKDLIIFVTYATDSILSYASYSIAINSFYCKLYNYKFHIVNSTDHIEYKTSLDPRWNKIHILKESITSWAMNAKYIIWLDSDLSIINYHFDLKSLLSKYEYADMLMSKDIETAPFVSNSGTIIIKNTNWTLHMLDLWWNSYDRVKCCDQNAFTWLYDRNIPIDIRSKVVLLPVDTINTNFPAWKNQHVYNSILHLAGLTSLYRIPIFHKGFTEICNHINQITIEDSDNMIVIVDEFINRLPKQLGLSREFLLSTMKQLNTLRYHALDRLFNKLPYVTTIQSLHNQQQSRMLDDYVTNNQSNQLNYSFRYLPNDRIYLLVSENIIQGYRKELEDIMKFDDDEKEYLPKEVDVVILRKKELIIREWIFWQLYDSTKQTLKIRITNNTKDKDGTIDNVIADNMDHNLQELNLYESVKETCSTGFEYVISMKLSYIAVTNKIDIHTNEQNEQHDFVSNVIFTSHCQFILKHVIDLINTIIIQSNLPTMLKGMFHYYLFKSYQLLAGSYQLGSFISYNQQESIQWLKLASIEWQQMVDHHYYTSNYVLADPEKEYATVLSELAMLYCLTNQHYNGLITYNTSIHLQQHTIEGYSFIRIATEDVIQFARIILVETYINAGICSIEYRNSSYINHAKYFFHQAINIMEAYSINNTKLTNIIQDYTRKLTISSTLIQQQQDDSVFINKDNSLQVGIQEHLEYLKQIENKAHTYSMINNNIPKQTQQTSPTTTSNVMRDINIQYIDSDDIDIYKNMINKEMKMKNIKVVKKKMKRKVIS